MGVHRRGANEADARCVECWQSWPCPSSTAEDGGVEDLVEVEVVAGGAGEGGKRGYSWPPFTEGHELSMRHGAYSPRRVDPLATELVGAELERAEVEGSPTVYLADPTYRAALWAWGRAEAQVQLLTEYLMGKAEISEDGVGDLDEDAVRAAYLLLHRAEARADRQRSKLGLDPLSRARLGADVASAAVDWARLMADAPGGEG